MASQRHGNRTRAGDGGKNENKSDGAMIPGDGNQSMVGVGADGVCRWAG